MKYSAFVILLSTIGMAAQAQSLDSLESNTKGFFIGVHLNGTSWTVDDLGVSGENGGGMGLKLGYGFNQLVTIYGNIDGAVINPNEGGNYSLAHFDLGVNFNFGSQQRALRPYVDLALTGRAAQVTVGPAEIEISGAGFTAGGGLKYFFSLPLALDVGLLGTFGKLDEVSVGSISENISADASAVRLNIGIVWYPGR